MMRLLKVELGRLFSRRLIRVLAIVGLLAFLGVDGLIAAHSSTDIAAAHTRADAFAQSQYQSCLAQVGLTQGRGPTRSDCENGLPAAQLKSCLANVQNQVAGPGQLTREECIRSSNPYFQDPRFHFADRAKDLLVSAAFIFMLLGLVIGASFIGAEWQSGTFASLLTWEPRRQRVLVAKLLASVIGVGILATALTAALVGGASRHYGRHDDAVDGTTRCHGRQGARACCAFHSDRSRARQFHPAYSCCRRCPGRLPCARRICRRHREFVVADSCARRPNNGHHSGSLRLLR
jgi:hypothetical protein